MVIRNKTYKKIHTTFYKVMAIPVVIYAIEKFAM